MESACPQSLNPCDMCLSARDNDTEKDAPSYDLHHEHPHPPWQRLSGFRLTVDVFDQ